MDTEREFGSADVFTLRLLFWEGDNDRSCYDVIFNYFSWQFKTFLTTLNLVFLFEVFQIVVICLSIQAFSAYSTSPLNSTCACRTTARVAKPQIETNFHFDNPDTTTSDIQFPARPSWCLKWCWFEMAALFVQIPKGLANCALISPARPPANLAALRRVWPQFFTQITQQLSTRAEKNSKIDDGKQRVKSFSRCKSHKFAGFWAPGQPENWKWRCQTSDENLTEIL